MIEVTKEPTNLFRWFKLYENCHFCNSKTDMWHLKTNTPVCSNCSKKRKVSEIINRKQKQ